MSTVVKGSHLATSLLCLIGAAALSQVVLPWILSRAADAAEKRDLLECHQKQLSTGGDDRDVRPWKTPSRTDELGVGSTQ